MSLEEPTAEPITPMLTPPTNQDLVPDPETVTAAKRIDRQVRIYGSAVVMLILAGLIVGILALSEFDLSNKQDLIGLGGLLSGSVTAIWSLAGLILIYVAFLGQRKAILRQEEEIALNRVELRESRSELAGQRKQLEEQSETFRIQQFESTFFQLLSLHHQNVSSTDIVVPARRRLGVEAKLIGDSEPERVLHGRDCFREMYDRFATGFQLEVKEYPDKHPLEQLQTAYLSFYERYESDLGHYFRNLYTMIKFVKQSSIIDKRRYTNMVRAQLSAYELLLLFYNCLNIYGNEKFKPLAEEFHLFKNMPRARVLSESHLAYFRPSAYQGSENEDNQKV
jgi:hypothetical protein